jgi:hypothetical protein
VATAADALKPEAKRSLTMTAPSRSSGRFLCSDEIGNVWHPYDGDCTHPRRALIATEKLMRHVIERTFREVAERNGQSVGRITEVRVLDRYFHS